MNIKVTIEVDGSTREVEEWLARFAISGSEAPNPSVRTQLALPLASNEWTPAKAERLVRRVTQGARLALWHIAEHAPEISFEDLQERMNISGVQLGGILASFGFAENAGLPRPFRTDKRGRRYLLDPAIADLFIDAIREVDKEEDAD